MDFEEKASRYAEEHGIIDYSVVGNKMTYYANYLAYLAEPRRTYKVTVNLETGMEEARMQLKRWNKAGNHNMYK